MEGLKVLAIGGLLILVIFAVGLADARVASDNFVSPQAPEGAGDGAATLADVLGQTSFESSAEGEGAVSDVDIDVSSSGDIDVSSSVKIDIWGGGSVRSDQSEKQEDKTTPPAADIKINEQTLSCPEGQRVEWESETAEFKCRNRNGKIDINWESKGSDPFRVKLKFP